MATDFNDLAGVIIGKYNIEPIIIDLPLVTETQLILHQGQVIDKVTRTYGEFAVMGDFHYGEIVFAERVMHGYINFLKQHSNIGIGFDGDIFNCASLSKYISSEKKELSDVDSQTDEFVADWKDLASRVKFALWGNHEERIIREGQNVPRTKRFYNDVIRNDLGAEDAFIGEPQRGVFVIFRAGEQMYGAYVHHSKTNARINQDLQLRRSGSQNVVSIIIHGHTHRLSFKPRTFTALESIDGKIYNLVKRQYLVATGCFLEYPSYAEAGSYPLTECGAPILKFYADNHQLGHYDLTTTYRRYLAKDSAGAGVDDAFDHVPVVRSANYNSFLQSPYGVRKQCLL